MKSLELQLNKRLLIVEVLEDTIGAFIDEYSLYTRLEGDNVYYHSDDTEVKKANPICRGSNLTEEIAAGMVEKSIHTGLYAHYVKDIPVNTYSYKEALCSIYSAIEGQGWYWKNNPVSLEREQTYRRMGDTHRADGILRAWIEHESCTFHPERTIIFEIVE